MAKVWPDALTNHNQMLAQQAERAWQAMPGAWKEQLHTCWLPLASHLAEFSEQYKATHHQPAIVGIHGGQGSGKSTLCRALADLYQQAFNWKVAVISIDDLYLTKHERQNLASEIHPLLATRGVPGTHDVVTGSELFQQLRTLGSNKYLNYPAFDKISDDRCPQDEWHGISGPVDLILFEGWCVGCQAADNTELQQPVNDLEQQEDSNGLWRQWVNDQLNDHYQPWFAQIDYLLMLKVPDIESVNQWRSQQERDNEKLSSNRQAASGMTDAQIRRFVQHYQRLTERALRDMPGYADLILELNNQHQVSAVHYNQTQVISVEESV